MSHGQREAQGGRRGAEMGGLCGRKDHLTRPNRPPFTVRCARRASNVSVSRILGRSRPRPVLRRDPWRTGRRPGGASGEIGPDEPVCVDRVHRDLHRVWRRGAARVPQRQPRQREQSVRRPEAQCGREAGAAAVRSRTAAVCHTLSAANAVGKVGPNLDTLKPPYGLVLNTINNGCLQDPGVERLRAMPRSGHDAWADRRGQGRAGRVLLRGQGRRAPIAPAKKCPHSGVVGRRGPGKRSCIRRYWYSPAPVQLNSRHRRVYGTRG